ncbi:DNA methyltransferase, partial [Fusobacterium ulcerans]|uniref:DNA methyltransferase n=1 Tax=Fusobacterium ulcerans TaxID=861 RepID=UPI0026EE1995
MSNLSQIRRAEMLEYLHHLKEIHTDDESRIALGKIETALTEKKYGLVWEEHEEEVDKQLVHNIPVFKEIEDKKIVRDNTTDFNFLLEGDNLHSLKLLDKTHKGNIDVIYIDPPYNTKNKEFVYDDNRVGLDDGFRHSKWLSFMGKRLDYAKNLLSDDGIIFINIDENEVHQLKILGDEIFGEDNFLGEFIWKARSGKGG